MKEKALFTVEIVGTGVNVQYDVVAHEILGLAAGTYHKLTFPKGVVMYCNDFGIRAVTVTPIE